MPTIVVCTEWYVLFEIWLSPYSAILSVSLEYSVTFASLNAVRVQCAVLSDVILGAEVLEHSEKV